jgi:hypothetical protein
MPTTLVNGAMLRYPEVARRRIIRGGRRERKVV